MPNPSGSGIDRYLSQGLSSSAASVATAGARSLLTGTDFGDNILRTLPDVVGNTIGNLVADRVAGSGRGVGSTGNAGKDAQTLSNSLAGRDPTSLLLGSLGYSPANAGAVASSIGASGDDIVVQATRQQLYDAKTIFAVGLYAPVHAVVVARGESTAQENYRIHEYVASGFTLNYGENEFTRAAWRYKSDFRSATNYFADVSNAERDAAIASNIAGVDRAGMAGLNTAMIPTMFMGGATLGYGASRASLSSVVAAESVGGSRLVQGLQFEADGTALARTEAFAQGGSTQRLSVRAFDDAGNLLPGRTVLDMAGTRLDNNAFGALEFKLTENALYTARQLEHFPYLAKNGGVVVGTKGEAIGLPAGSRLPAFNPNRINGPTLPGSNGWWPQ